MRHDEEGSASTWRDLLTPQARARAEAALAHMREHPWRGPLPEQHDPEECTSPHHDRAHGPCTDTGQCPFCSLPIPALRPSGETYGLHADDCALPERHYGPCEHGGDGHEPGLVRGYWPGMDDDIARARARHQETDR